MDILIKAAAVSVAAAVLALVIKKSSPDMALLLGLMTCCTVIEASLSVMSGITDFLYTLLDYTGLDGDALTIIMKSVAIAIITKLASDICRDAQQSALSSSLELCGSAAVLYIAVPLIKAVVQMINSLIQ